MSNIKNQRRAEFLGMPHGTASHKLRKSLLYKYVRLANHHFCYKCGAKIETVDELSIEHKKPWENIDPALFWDLDNITFSHLVCNKKHSKRNQYTHISELAPDGTKWCGKCRTYLLKDSFAKNKSEEDGYRSYCRECDPPR